ncbi:MAG: PAS-domain containing protein, partial [Rhodospirillales bacterium]|nr:PAS-domain containing protein [Rhodospirillales bacterium]
MTDPPPAPESETADVAALRRENAILRQVLDAIDGTIVVYDAERRFVLSNKAYHDYFPHLPPDHVLVGQRYEALLERSIDAGASVDPSAKTDRAAFIARRIQEIEQRRVPAREIQDSSYGKWYMVRVSHTP